MLILLGGLDHETTSTYLLHLEVSDGGIDGMNVFTSSATVNISVLDVNEYSPAFVDGSVYQVTILEEQIQANVFTVSILTYFVVVVMFHPLLSHMQCVAASSSCRVPSLFPLDRSILTTLLSPST